MTRLIVDRQGARLRKEGARLLVRYEGETVESTPIEGLEQVLLLGWGVAASTPLLHDLVRRGVDVVYMTQNGHYAFRLAGPLAKHSALRADQVLVAADPRRALALARAVVVGKLANQDAVLARQGEAFGVEVGDARRAIGQQGTLAARAADLDSLRGHEGYAARAYFAAWRRIVPEAWGFDGRNYYPPRDPLNALLSYGYTLLLYDLVGVVYRVGLDPAIGFFHTVDFGRPSLALDLEEEFRPVLVDTLVLDLVRREALLPGDFEREEAKDGGGAIRLCDEGRRFFLQCYQNRLQGRVHYPQWDRDLTYRHALASQVEHMARCIQGRDGRYQPLVLA